MRKRTGGRIVGGRNLVKMDFDEGLTLIWTGDLNPL